eukprot:514023-Prymnesium_polylepis.2
MLARDPPLCPCETDGPRDTADTGLTARPAATPETHVPLENDEATSVTSRNAESRSAESGMERTKN